MNRVSWALKANGMVQSIRNPSKMFNLYLIKQNIFGRLYKYLGIVLYIIQFILNLKSIISMKCLKMYQIVTKHEKEKHDVDTKFIKISVNISL